jgi:D-alanyl-D-alanine carboxypeptidase (penicillin-binding protein 5/6)
MNSFSPRKLSVSHRVVIDRRSEATTKVEIALRMQTRTSRHHKREIVWNPADRALRPGLLLLLMAATLFTVGFSGPRLVDHPLAPTLRLSMEELRQVQAAQAPTTLSARACLLYDVTAERVLLAHAEDIPLPPASLTKLMTALLVLERGELTGTVTIVGADLVGEASMGLTAGERVTVEQLLWGLLLPSGNDAAMALARHVAGNVDAFVAQMNARAAALGLTQSHFVNPHGLDADLQTTSAADLLILARELWRFPLFRTIVATAERTVAGHKLVNTNELLITRPDVHGVKTGTSAAAGECLIVSIEQDGHLRFLIILGSRDRYGDARTLLAQAAVSYRWWLPNGRETPALNQLDDPAGERWYLRAVGPAAGRLLWAWEWRQVRSFRRLSLPRHGVPWTPGLKVGMIEWRLGNDVIARQTLVLW